MYYKVLVIIVKTPLTILRPEVLKPISNYPILISDRPADFPYSKTRSSNFNRSLSQQLLRYNDTIKSEYIFMLDSDCVIPENSIELLLKEIKPHETLCIRTKEKSSHIVCSACLISTEDYLNVDFNTMDCHCKHMPNPRYIKGVSGYELK